MVNAIGKCPGGAAVPIGANYVPVASDGSTAPSSTAFQSAKRRGLYREVPRETVFVPNCGRGHLPIQPSSLSVRHRALGEFISKTHCDGFLYSSGERVEHADRRFADFGD
jgi:hypothetical protein